MAGLLCNVSCFINGSILNPTVMPVFKLDSTDMPILKSIFKQNAEFPSDIKVHRSVSLISRYAKTIRYNPNI